MIDLLIGYVAFSVAILPDESFVLACHAGVLARVSNVSPYPIQWYNSFGGYSCFYFKVVVLADSSIMAIGTCPIAGKGDDCIAVRVSAAGALLAANTYGGVGNELCLDIIKLADGNLAAVGDTWSNSNKNSDVFVLKIDEATGLIWSYSFGGTGYDYGRGITQMQNGSIAVVGFTNSHDPNNYDAWLILLNSQGIKTSDHLWEHVFPNWKLYSCYK